MAGGIAHMTITYQVEKFADAVADVSQHIDAHWEEVGSFKERFQRQIDYAAYHRLEEAGRLLTVTMREPGAANTRSSSRLVSAKWPR